MQHLKENPRIYNKKCFVFIFICKAPNGVLHLVLSLLLKRTLELRAYILFNVIFVFVDKSFKFSPIYLLFFLYIHLI